MNECTHKIDLAQEKKQVTAEFMRTWCRRYIVIRDAWIAGRIDDARAECLATRFARAVGPVALEGLHSKNKGERIAAEELNKFVSNCCNETNRMRDAICYLNEYQPAGDDGAQIRRAALNIRRLPRWTGGWLKLAATR